MSERNDPRLFVTIAVRLFQIFLKPVVLICNLLPSIIHIEIVFGWERNDVRFADVERVEVVVLTAQTVFSARIDHRETVVVVRKVALEVRRKEVLEWFISKKLE